MKKAILVLIVIVVSAANAGWDKTYGGDYNDYGNAIRQTSDGGYIIAGSSASFGSINERMTKGWLLKLDQDGNKEWEYDFGDNDKKSGFETIELTPDGGFIVGGHNEILVNTNKVNKKWLVKFDEQGNIVWDSVYSERIAGGIKSVGCTPDQGYIIGGFGDSTITKTDKVGKVEFGRKLGWLIHDVLPMKDGGYIISGENVGIPKDFGYIPSPFITKIGADGTVTWENPYEKSDLGRFMAAKETPDGGLVVVGDKIEKIDDQPETGRLVVTKFDGSGSVEWEHTGSDFSGGFDVEIHGDEIIVLGNVIDSQHSPDYYVAWLDRDGVVKWDTSFGGDNFDYPSESIIDENGDIVIIGQTASKGAGLYDLQIIKIELPDNPSPVEYEKSEGQYSVMNFPNPCSIGTLVRVTCSDVNPGQIRMLLYDEAGNFVRSVNGFQGTNGNYSSLIETDDLKDGVYYYLVETGLGTFNGKMQKMK